MAVNVTIKGLDNAIRIFNKIPLKLERDIRNQVIKSAFKIETDAKRRAASDTGRLRSSIQTEIRKAGFEAIIFSDANYAAAIEKGTRPHFPPPTALEGWARRHGMRGLEFMIARTIARRGTPPRPFLYPAWETERPDFIYAMKKIAKSLERVS